MLYNIICVVVMVLVTYIPRAFPVAFFKRKIENNFVKSFLYYVPYAVIASLIFPTVFFCSGNIYLAIIGTVTAIILSFFKQKLYVVALVSVAVIFGFSYLFY